MKTLASAAKAVTVLNRITPKWRFFIWIVLLSLSTLYGAILWLHGGKIQRDILAMLPPIKQDVLVERAIAQVEDRLANQIYVALIADTDEAAIDAAQRFMAQLTHTHFTDVQTQDNINSQPTSAFIQVTSADVDSGKALAQFYFPYRFQLLTPQQAKLLKDDQLATLLEQAAEQLYSAFGYANSELITEDPLLLFPANVTALAPNNQFRVKQGILLTNSGQHSAAIVMAKGRDSVFNPNAQAAQLAALAQAFDSVKLYYPELQTLQAGALFHAQAATDSAKQEISIIGLGSLIGVILLVWLAFRSIMPLLFALLTISTGLILAGVSTLALFGEIHLLTLVFGTSLIGIAIDYSFHYYCQRLARPNTTASETVAHIFPAVSLALLTSALAYIAIGFTPFPGMQQVAVFCAAGLVGAYLTLILAYPLLASSPLPNRTAPLALAQQYLALMQSQGDKLRHPRLNLGLTVFGLCLLSGTFVGLLNLRSDDNIRNLQQSPAGIIETENTLRQLLSGGTDNQFLLVRADTEDALKQRLEQLTPVLNIAVQNHEVTQFISLSPYLPSQAKQDANYQLQAKVYHQQLDHIISTLGLNEALKEHLVNAYDDAQAITISADEFLTTAQSALSALWLKPTDTSAQFGAIVLLGGINNLPALQYRLQNEAQVQLIDKVADISHIMGQYRQLTLLLLCVALGLASILFSLRFGYKNALIIVAVPALAAIFTIASLGLAGSPLTLFHALALILVFGIGVDYSLFFAESEQQGASVMMAVFMSACSTLMAFGLLALSETHAIHYFGLTLALGIGFTFILSPFIRAFTRKVS